MNTVINDWSEMDDAAISKIDPSTITIAPNFVDSVLGFDPYGDWAVEPRLSFYWAVSKIAFAAKAPVEKFTPEMYGSDAEYTKGRDEPEGYEGN